MLGNFKSKLGKLGTQIGDMTFTNLLRVQLHGVLTGNHFDQYYFDATAENYSNYNAYSLALASFLAYLLNSEQSGKLQLDKKAIEKEIKRIDQQNSQQTEEIYTKLENWLKNFPDSYFITGNEFGLAGKQGLTVLCSNTQALILKNDEVIIVAFRGTHQVADCFTDLQLIHSRQFAGGFGVHNGFYESMMSVWPEVWEQIKPEARGERTLWFTGHSLGAALAKLATAMCLFDEKYNEQIPNGLYTYGQPKVCDHKFCAVFDEKFKHRTFRFVNNNDIVPFLPLGPSDFEVKLPNVFHSIPKFDYTLLNTLFIIDYHHSGHFKLFDANGVLQDESFGIVDKWLDRVAGHLKNSFKLDPASLKIVLSLNPLEIMKSVMWRAIERHDGIYDHFIAQYVINLKKHLDQWEKEHPSAAPSSPERV